MGERSRPVVPENGYRENSQYGDSLYGKSAVKLKKLLEINIFNWYLMNFSKLNLEHYGTLHVLSKYVNFFSKYSQLTKVTIVSHVNYTFLRLTFL
jgi:hypothetical protein